MIAEIVVQGGQGAPKRVTARRTRSSVLGYASCVLGALMLIASDASAERISLLGFEGDSARALRWRVAQVLKRAGHTVVGFAPPKNPDSESQLRAYARRRRVDVFIGGSSVEGSDGWELTLTVKDAEGGTVGSGVTFNAPSLRAMVQEIKAEGEQRLDSAVRGGGAASASGGDVDVDARPSGDFAARERARARKKKPGRAPAREVEEPIDLDESDAAEPAEDEEPAAPRRKASARAAAASTAIEVDDPAPSEDSDAEEPRTADASGWAASDTAASNEDDGRESFLSGDAAKESSDVGEDDGASSDESGAGSEDPTVVLGLTAGFVRRTLGYSDDIYGRLRAPSANSWVYRLDAAVYPFARPVKNRIGLIAGYESEFSGVVRDNAAGTDFGVTFSEIFGGLRLRQPFGRHEVSLDGTLGSMQAGLDDPAGTSGVPEFDYTSLRAALNLGLQFGNLAVRGAVGYRLPIGGYGQASDADWFPRMEGSGMEGSLGLQYRFTKEVAFAVSGSMRRFLLQMNSLPSDAIAGEAEVAGGAVDLYLGGYFGLNITL